ncbi:MAG TPA: tetratricopeptide repeat protein, partial [Myxococcota bacterium]
DQRLLELGALATLFKSADAPLVEKADKAVAALVPIKRCGNVIALQAEDRDPVGDATAQAQIATLKRALAATNAALYAGKIDVVIKQGADAEKLATELHYAPGVFDALLAEGQALSVSGKGADADKALSAAAFQALKSKHDDVAADAALYAAQNAADALNKPDEANVWLGLADASIARIGGDKALDIHALEVQAVAAGDRGDLVAAAALGEKALALAAETYGADAPRLWKSEQVVAATYAKGGAYAKAIPHFERALALKEKAAGPDHPDVALILTSLGGSYDNVGETQKARAALERSLAIRELNFGNDTPKLVATLNNLADVVRHSVDGKPGDLDAALAFADRGFAIASKVPGPAHPLTHTVATTRAEIFVDRGELAKAHAAFDDVLAQESKVSSPMLPTTRASRGQLALVEKNWAEAATFFEPSIAGFEKAGGNDAADLWRPLIGLGLAKLHLGDKPQAKVLLERGIAIGDKTQVKASDLAAAKQALTSL